ncbi:MAG: ABC transporter ATP-binding protein [Myxococcota bacterium]
MITVDDLHYTYPGSEHATLRGLSFEVADKEILGFLGPSGAGKSTTQRLLTGLLTDYRGRVQVLGRELRDWGHEYYERVGVSFELPNHHQRLTALENLQHFGSLYRGPIVDPLEVLRWVDLEPDAQKRVSDFSKGMKIRLNVARSLLHRPQLLFLDEPTSGLDPVNAKRIKDLVQLVRSEGTTVFVTTHDMTVADELCDRVAFIADGRLVAIDAPAAFKKRYGKRELVVEYRDASAGALRRADFGLNALDRSEEFQDLIRHSERIETMHTQETTLENVFIEVTGQELQG